MGRLTAFAFSFVGIVGVTHARDPGCGASSSDEKSLVGAPCTRPKDCVQGAVCMSGVCMEVDAEILGDAGDGGDGGG